MCRRAQVQTHYLLEEQVQLEESFILSLDKNERSAYEKMVEKNHKLPAGKITGTLTSGAIIILGLAGKSAAVIAATLAGIGGSMVGGIALITALPFMGEAFDSITSFFDGVAVLLSMVGGF